MCADEDLEGYDKMVTGKRKTQRVRSQTLLYVALYAHLILILFVRCCFAVEPTE